LARETTNLTRRGFLGGAAMLGLLGTGCGYLLYPERRGRRGGVIDGLPLIVDILWLIPGLVPGLICLIVDFGTGCIYAGGERGAGEPRGPGSPVEIGVEVEGTRVASGWVQPDGRADLVWTKQIDAETLRTHGRLVATNHQDDRAVAHMRDLV
jgi:hypothetical protein